jgi:hypothetical protein
MVMASAAERSRGRIALEAKVWNERFDAGHSLVREEPGEASFDEIIARGIEHGREISKTS